MTHIHEFLGVHVIADWHSWVWPTCMYVDTYVYCKNRSLIESLALYAWQLLFWCHIMLLQARLSGAIWGWNSCQRLQPAAAGVPWDGQTFSQHSPRGQHMQTISTTLSKVFLQPLHVGWVCEHLCVGCICVHMRMGRGAMYLCVHIYLESDLAQGKQLCGIVLYLECFRI